MSRQSRLLNTPESCARSRLMCKKITFKLASGEMKAMEASVCSKFFFSLPLITDLYEVSFFKALLKKKSVICGRSLY